MYRLKTISYFLKFKACDFKKKGCLIQNDLCNIYYE